VASQCNVAARVRFGREKESKKLADDLRAAQSGRDSVVCELNDVKTQLKIVEESCDSLRRSLLDVNRQLSLGQLVS